jgi:peroxiredoxin
MAFRLVPDQRSETDFLCNLPEVGRSHPLPAGRGNMMLETDAAGGYTAGTPPNEEMLALAAKAAKQASHAGQFAPTFRLHDLHGNSTAFIDLIGQRSLVISFYRGIWCSFCDSALDALSRINTDLQALGATQVAIGPPPGNEDERRRLLALSLPVLIDPGLRVSTAYGLTIALPDALQGAYEKAGYVPQPAPCDGKWLVPVPATYVIDRHGRIILASIDADYRNRLKPAQVLSALRGLQKSAAPPTFKE